MISCQLKRLSNSVDGLRVPDDNDKMWFRIGLVVANGSKIKQKPYQSPSPDRMLSDGP